MREIVQELISESYSELQDSEFSFRDINEDEDHFLSSIFERARSG